MTEVVMMRVQPCRVVLQGSSGSGIEGGGKGLTV